ncbi:Pkinase-fungal domain-containing protein [Mycena sanguinolenta]|uniref:Pkinase-fungal domain-containing protein n=1 Tax=Mycena sanguinolenta TaxID=230812 RepID=A0A8H7D3N9_9AGAR|nr:Pkinase-fungal domain-containing protein [Mycena sanguinolenta]
MSHSPTTRSAPSPPSRTPESASASTSRADAPSPATPPKNAGGTQVVASLGSANTPRKTRPGSGVANNTIESQKQDDLRNKIVWKTTMMDNFKEIVEVHEFLKTYMSRDDDSSTINKIVTQAATSLEAAEKDVPAATNEKATSKSLINYLKQVVSQFSANNKPFVGDTQNTLFESIQENEHDTMPDITISRPGFKEKPTSWAEAGTVIELKHKTDIFNDQGQINGSEESSKALIQIAKSARSLLISSHSCHVYVVACFNRGWARILRFDRAGFRATSAFNWLKAPTIFPTFLYRLYHPPTSGRMDGDDDTISVPSSSDKERMYLALLAHDFYQKGENFSEKDATKNSVWLKAVRFVDVDGKRNAQPVDCFTIGDDLSIADGLFGRATRVYRVILKQDINNDEPPPIYALKARSLWTQIHSHLTGFFFFWNLKDSWRQSCRRPEVDFYDTIAGYCKKEEINMDEEGMARCHGSIDLSAGTIPLVGEERSDRALHVTCSAKTYERHHTRTLLTPVGKPLKSFDCTKSLTHALHNAIRHHQIACAGGVLHRDVSEGNVLFREVSVKGEKLKGFLVDWDYAEFIQDGLKNFEAEFPDRAKISEYTAPDKSLKDFTGTFPFVAIEMIDSFNAKTLHGSHHDLESFYWLIIWMILRHTDHKHPNDELACSKLFDHSTSDVKRGWLMRKQFTQDLPLFQLANALREQLLDQYPPESSRSKRREAENLTYENVLADFDQHLKSNAWPTDDKALPYIAPSADPSKNVTQSKGGSRLAGTGSRSTRSGTSKRPRPDELDATDPVASVSSAGTTAVASDGTERRRSKKSKASNGQAD